MGDLLEHNLILTAKVNELDTLLAQNRRKFTVQGFIESHLDVVVYLK